MPFKILILFFDAYTLDRASINGLFDFVCIDAIVSHNLDIALAIDHLKNLRANTLTGAAADAYFFIDDWFHITSVIY